MASSYWIRRVPVETKIQDLESKQAPGHRSPANGLLDAARLRVHRAHDPGGVVGSCFRGPAALILQSIDDISDCRVRLFVESEAAAEHLHHAAVLDLPVCPRPRGGA